MSITCLTAIRFFCNPPPAGAHDPGLALSGDALDRRRLQQRLSLVPRRQSVHSHALQVAKQTGMKAAALFAR